MKLQLFDLNANYLPSSFSATVVTLVTSVSTMVDKAISHDQFSRMLNRRQPEPRAWLQMAKGI